MHTETIIYADKIETKVADEPRIIIKLAPGVYHVSHPIELPPTMRIEGTNA